MIVPAILLVNAHRILFCVNFGLANLSDAAMAAACGAAAEAPKSDRRRLALGRGGQRRGQRAVNDEEAIIIVQCAGRIAPVQCQKKP